MLRMMSNLQRKEPLSFRMRPEILEELVGHEELVGEGKILYKMIKSDTLSSLILSGPPGTGKTTLARVIANSTKAQFKKLNAVISGIADIKRIVEDAGNQILNPAGRTVLFIDEIHRFNKAQQDFLLPYVENGTVVLIGATTENPFFAVNKALISRSHVFVLKPLNAENIKTVILNALSNKEKGYGNFKIDIEKEAIEFLSIFSNGDARMALNTLEMAVGISRVAKNGKIVIGLNVIKECIQKKNISYDKSGEEHYDNISAFIKSMRGSDPDAAVFYLARALYAGEDPMFLARRIIICASEDVGMANSSALQTAVLAAQAVQMVGMPEARIILSHAAIMVATSPKSNACYLAINKALNDVQSKDTGTVPMHLRNAVVEGMAEMGYGKGYKYVHDYPGNIVKEEYLPDKMKGTIYYNPTSNGFEAKLKEWLTDRRK